MDGGPDGRSWREVTQPGEESGSASEWVEGRATDKKDEEYWGIKVCRRNSVRTICIFGVHHKYQEETPINGFLSSHLRGLVNDHQVDTILEEGTGLRPKSCIEVLADSLGIRWKNVGLSREQRLLTPDAAKCSPREDTFQDLGLHEFREWVWVVRTSATVTNSGLLLCGLCHVLSVAEKFRWLDFEIEAHVYCPRRDEELYL